MAQEPPDPYRVLGVAPDAGAAEISRAFRRRARDVHPDANPGKDAGAFQALTEAYDLIADPIRRVEYDNRRRRRFSGPDMPVRVVPTSRTERSSPISFPPA